MTGGIPPITTHQCHPAPCRCRPMMTQPGSKTWSSTTDGMMCGCLCVLVGLRTLRTFGPSAPTCRPLLTCLTALIHATRKDVRYHRSLRASRQDRRRHHRQGLQRQVHDDLAPARQQVRRDERARERDEMKKVGEGWRSRGRCAYRERAHASRGDVARGGDVMNNNIISHRSRGETETRADERARRRSSDGSSAEGWGRKPFFPEGLDLCRWTS